MAYLSRSYLSEDQGQQPGQGGAAGSAPPASSAGTPSSGGGVSAPGAQQVSGSYPMITSYLNANKDQGSALASDVAGKIGGEVKAAQDQNATDAANWTRVNSEAQNNWKSNNDTAYQQYLAQQEQARKDAAANAAGTPGLVNMTPNASHDHDPGGNSYGPNTYTGAQQKTYDTTYQNWAAPAFDPGQAPALTAWQPDTSKVTAAQNDLSALASDSGRETYLAGRYAGGGQPGMTGLDAALLGRGMTGQDLSGYSGILSSLRGASQPTAPTAPKTDYPTEGPSHKTGPAAPRAPQQTPPTTNQPSPQNPGDGTPGRKNKDPR